LNSKGFDPERHAYAFGFFNEYLEAVQKKKSSDVILCVSLEWLNNPGQQRAFRQKIAVGLGLGLFCNALS